MAVEWSSLPIDWRLAVQSDHPMQSNASLKARGNRQRSTTPEVWTKRLVPTY